MGRFDSSRKERNQGQPDFHNQIAQYLDNNNCLLIDEEHSNPDRLLPSPNSMILPNRQREFELR